MFRIYLIFNQSPIFFYFLGTPGTDSTISIEDFRVVVICCVWRKDFPVSPHISSNTWFRCCWSSGYCGAAATSTVLVLWLLFPWIMLPGGCSRGSYSCGCCSCGCSHCFCCRGFSSRSCSSRGFCSSLVCYSRGCCTLSNGNGVIYSFFVLSQ
jgi:hypothetical protein